MALTIESVRNALHRVESIPGMAEDVMLLREWIAHQEAIIGSQAQRILELKEHEDRLSALLDEEA